MLDLQVWVDKRMGLPDRIAWVFYEKTSASCRVLRSHSAYRWRSKIVTMSQETFRRMRTTTRQATLETRLCILSDFTRKLRASGYPAVTVNNILESGLRFYYWKLRTALQGCPGPSPRKEKEAGSS